MVVVFLIDVFTRDELLAGRLVGFGRLRQPASPRESSSVSLTGRILYRFVNSGTGCGIEVVEWRVGHIFEVVLTRPSSWGGGISECALSKMSVKIKEDASSKEVPSSPSEKDRSAEKMCTPVDKSLVVAVESNAGRPTLLPPSTESPWAAPLVQPQSLLPGAPPSCRSNPLTGDLSSGT